MERIKKYNFTAASKKGAIDSHRYPQPYIYTTYTAIHTYIDIIPMTSLINLDTTTYDLRDDPSTLLYSSNKTNNSNIFPLLSMFYCICST